MVLSSKHKEEIIKQLVKYMSPWRVYEISHLSEITLKNCSYSAARGRRYAQLTNTQIGKLITPFKTIHKLTAYNRTYYAKIPRYNKLYN